MPYLEALVLFLLILLNVLILFQFQNIISELGYYTYTRNSRLRCISAMTLYNIILSGLTSFSPNNF